MLSDELLPGDLFEVPGDGCFMPCDAILVSGTVIVDESILTGEAIPIIKNHIPNSSEIFDKKNDRRYILFSGTKIIQKRNLAQTKVMAIVINTGYMTEKGKLIKSVLVPKPNSNKFKIDSYQYIKIMAILSLVGFLIASKFMLDHKMSLLDILLKGGDLISTMVPPALPVCLGIGVYYTLLHLKRVKIYCIDRERVNLLGQINVVCFDKTGTLTEDTLRVHGYQLVNYVEEDFSFEKFRTELSDIIDDSYNFYKETMVQDNQNLNRKEQILNKMKNLRLYYIECMATCHSITKVNNNMIGDPIDLEIFEKTNWVLKENLEDSENMDPLVLTYVHYKEEKDLKVILSKLDSCDFDEEERLIKAQYEIGIVRRFDFSSKLQRMSVIVKNMNEDFFKIYCKGSPESVRDLCNDETIPENFDKVLSGFVKSGYRVLGLSYKLIKMNYLSSQKITRETAESNMSFLGFVIIQNELKKRTANTITKLQNAGIKLLISTGDNMLTAASVARDCGIVNCNTEIYTCNLEKLEVSTRKILTIKRLEFAETYEPEVEYDNLFLNNGLHDEVSRKGSEYQKQYSKYLKLDRNMSMEVIEDDDDDNDSELFDEDNFYNPAIELKYCNNKSRSESFSPSTVKASNNNLKLKRKLTKEDFESILIDMQGIQHEFYSSTNNNQILAITGPVFENIIRMRNKYIALKNGNLFLNSNNSNNEIILENLNETESTYRVFSEIYNCILSSAVIFARMSPDQKAMLIEALKQENLIVAMCGDGINDISALKAAHIGVSLSEEEASIAAHFTSLIPDISCLIRLIREGKANLTTSVELFKFMMVYSLIQFFSSIALLVQGTYLSDNQFLIVDLFIIFPLAILIAR